MPDQSPVKYGLLITVLLHLLFSPDALANDPFLQNEYALDLQKQGDYLKSLEHLREAFRNYPHDEVMKRNLASAYVIAGQKQMGNGQFTEAAEYFSRSVELFPDIGEYRLFHGISLAALKQYDFASVEFERARGLLGENKAYLYHQGRVRYETGNLYDAVDLWSKALVIDPGDSSLRTFLEKTKKELAVETGMKKGYSGRFSISYDTSSSNDSADGILEVLEEAYNKVGSFLGSFPEARVPVLVYTRKNFKDLVAGPDWSGGVYDGKIRLPIGSVESMTHLVRSVLFHEYAHVVVYELTRGNCPMWLNEGIAEYFGRSQEDSHRSHRDHTEKHAVGLSISQLEQSFTSLSPREAALAYQQSFSLVTFIIQRYGAHKIPDLLVKLGSGVTTEKAFAEVFSDYSLSYQSVITDWQSSLYGEMAN